MSAYHDKLSAFLDGELPEDEARAIEAALAEDPALQAELESLMKADNAAQDAFKSVEDEPVPFALAAAIRNAPGPEATAPVSQPANDAMPATRRTGWMAIAAAAGIALLAGGVGGYITGQASLEQQVATAPGWLVDIADYHAVYAGQTRHLVEVPASESAHIETWLTGTLGDDVRIPDLSEHGLEFQGARLLVAAGKPVAQLMYLDGEGMVVALCQIQTATPRDGFGMITLGAFDMVSWGGESSNFVVVGDEGRAELDAIARTAATQV